MSPLKRRDLSAAGKGYASPFVGPYDHTHAVRLDVSTLTQGAAGEVDSDGYLKPGTPIQISPTGDPAGAVQGALVTAADQRAGVVIEPLRVLDSGETPATGTDQDVAVAFGTAVNRAVVEDNLGRALTAAEVGALRNAGVEVLE